MNNKSDGAKQFLKFLGIGYLNALVYYLSYSLLVWLGVHYIVSNAVGFVLSVISSFLLNGRLVFKEDGSKEKRVWWRVLFKVFATNFFHRPAAHQPAAEVLARYCGAAQGYGACERGTRSVGPRDKRPQARGVCRSRYQSLHHDTAEFLYQQILDIQTKT